jgi:hypothetical protein
MIDNEILSLADDQWMSEFTSWRDSVQYPVQASPEDDYNIEAWGLLDSRLGVFRPAWIVESVFQCLYITKHNIKDAFESIPMPHKPKPFATMAENALSVNHVLISDDLLSQMEEIWTHKARQQESHGASESEELFATIVYHTEISSTWELKRFISCVVFDKEALDGLRTHSKRQTSHIALTNAKEFTRMNAENLLEGLQRHPIETNLAAAMARRGQYLRKVAGTPSGIQRPTFEFVDATEQHVSVVYDLVRKVYKWRKTGPEEPVDSCLRFSRHSFSLTNTPEVPTVSSYFSVSVPSKHENFVLVARERYAQGISFLKPGLCLYQVKPTEDPPSKKELAQALWSACKNDVVYWTDIGYNNWKAQQKLKIAKSAGSKNAWDPVVEWLHEMQPSLIADTIEAPNPEVGVQDKPVAAGHDKFNLAKSKNSMLSVQTSSPIDTSNDDAKQSCIGISNCAASEIPSSEFWENEDTELTLMVQESILTYYAERGTENSLNSSESTVHNASEQSIAQGIQGNGPPDIDQGAIVVSGQRQLMPEQNVHPETKHTFTAADSKAQGKIENMDRTSATSLCSRSPSRRSSPPSLVDSATSTPPMRATSPSPCPPLFVATLSYSKRQLEHEDDDDQLIVYEKKARM